MDGLCEELLPIIFDPDVMPVKVNKKDGFDLVETSACNFYDGVTQSEVEEYYASKKNPDDKEPLSYGLNTTVKNVMDGLLKRFGELEQNMAQQ